MRRFAASALAFFVVTAANGLGAADPTCGVPPCDCGYCQRPVEIHVVPCYTGPKERHYWWKCLAPPRGEIVETVAVERVAAPFVRSEMVVSREQLRVLPAVAAERQLEAERLRLVPLRERAGAPAERERDIDEADCPEAAKKSCALPGESGEQLEKRIHELEKTLEALREMMVEERQQRLEQLRAEEARKGS